MKSFHIAALALLCGWLMTTLAAQADEYLFGPLDKLNVKIVEWQPSTGTMRDWSQVNGDYTVTSSGNIELPLAGSIPAAGRNAADLAQAIATQLAQKLALTDQVSASVQVTQFRPIYLTGDVQTPGSYPFVPGLTLVKALSLGGGLRRLPEDQHGTANSDFIAAKGNYDVLVSQLDRYYADRARLEAQLTNSPKVAIPTELKNNPQAVQLVASEQSIMDTQNDQDNIQLQNIAALKTLLNSQLASLSKQDAAQQTELQVLQQELSNVSSLVQKGLAVNSQTLLLDQQIADLESRNLDTSIAQLSTNKDINAADQSAATVRTTRQGQVQQAMQDTNDQIVQTAAKIDSAREAMLDAVVRSADMPTTGSNGDATQVAATYTITREVDGEPKEMPATEITPVEPGDVIKVNLGIASSAAL